MGRRKGPRKDWVYRGPEYDADTGAILTTQVAAYTDLDRNGGAYTLSVGSPAGLVLVDAYDYLTQGVRLISGAQAVMMGREARPEGKPMNIHAVEIDLFLQPTSWTAGTDFMLGARLVICDQNLLTGGLDLPTSYNILQNATLGAEPALYANGWGALKTWYMRQAFATENDMARFRLRGFWKAAQVAAPHLPRTLHRVRRTGYRVHLYPVRGALPHAR